MKRIWQNEWAQVTAVFGLLGLLFLNRALFPASGEALGNHDMRALFVPWLELTREAVWNGRFPFWHEAQFSGYPFLSNPQVAIFYPPTWLALLLPVRVGISWFLWLHLLVAGVGMYALVRALHGRGLGPWLAGLTFAFSGFTAVRLWAGHMGLLATDAWLPWLLLATHWAVQRRSSWAGVIAGVPLGLAILAGHTTSLIYVGIIWVIFVLYLGIGRLEIGDWRLKNVTSPQSLISNLFLVGRQFLIAFAVGLLLSAVQLLPLLQFSQVSTRTAAPSFEFASAYSLPPAHLLTLLVPEFFGEPLRAGYWSVPNFEELTYYAGVLPLLALLLVWRRPDRRALLYIGLLALGLLLALGSYSFLYRLAYDLLPPFQLARAPGRAAFLYVVATALLLGQLGNRPPDPGLGRWLKWIVVVTAVSGVTILAATGAVFISIHPTETSGRLWHQLGGWLTAVLLLLIGCGLLWWNNKVSETHREDTGKHRGKEKISAFSALSLRNAAFLLLPLLILIDLWGFGLKFIQTSSTAYDPFWDDVAAVVGDSSQRVLPWGVDIFSQNGAWQAGLNSVFGYNALEVGANIALAESVPDPRSTAYDILGAGYVVSKVPLPQYEDGKRPLTLKTQSGSAWVYGRTRTLPLARLVYQVETIPNEAAAIARIHQPDFDPAVTAIVDSSPSCNLQSPNNPVTAVIEAQWDGHWRIRTSSETPGMLIISETAFPGWRVWVDGQEIEWQKAYTAVRAVCVPAGEHEVVWRFVPLIFAWGGGLTLLGLVFVLLAVSRSR